MILIDGVRVKFGEFPNKESNLNFNTIKFSNTSVVVFKYETDACLMKLYILKRFMDEVFPNNSITLRILYMPYSRMDRRSDVYTFNLKYVCDFINSMKFYKVTTYDAHSEVTNALLDKAEDLSVIPGLVNYHYRRVGMTNTVVFFPDAGAQKRYGGTIQYPAIVGHKHRDFKTGNILEYSIHGDFCAGANILIVDDLCSKGGTFIAAAKLLKERGAANVYLIVAHCEETVFTGELLSSGLVDKVYTTNSILKLSMCTDKLNIMAMYKEVRKWD